jgi:serine/alanine adding enzyme
VCSTSIDVVRAESPDWPAPQTDPARGYGLAHAPEWFTVIRRAYGHEPFYLYAEDRAGGSGLLPAFIVRRPIGGTALTSMPFLDSGGPCGNSQAVNDALVSQLIDQARRAGADVIDLRCTHRLNLDEQPLEHKVNMILSLLPDADALWRRLDSSVRNQVRKAGRSGLTVEDAGVERLDEFYAIFAQRMRELGSPVHAKGFFAEIFHAFQDRARLTFVVREGTPIGGLVALSIEDTVVVPWASCLSQHFTLCPNMLLYWETIRRACADGARRFDFGRSSRNSGTFRFKRQWGAAPAPLFWYSIRVSQRQQSARPGSGRSAACAAGLWQRLPLSVTTTIGPHIRKYLIQ